MAVSLPIDEILPSVVQALDTTGRAVLQAPPGAGKTTRVPLALLDSSWRGDERIVMLEPRRVAARAAAQRLAELSDTSVGGLIGYRMRQDTKVGPDTRVEVVTEGVLTRMLQADPSLEGVAAVIFDEFHERSLQADLGLALVLDARAALRPELRLLVMSATLDGERVAGLLDDAPVVTSEGRQYPVETHYRPPPSGSRIEDHLADVVADVCRTSEGDVLAFLPGAGWIRRAQERLQPKLPNGIVVTPLYGMLSPAEQDRAIRSDPQGHRKVVLATDIAETSLTIPGVRVVVDGGYRRAPRFDPRSGLTRLETVRISMASADQRRGRAGRQGPGVCHRLWVESDNRHLDLFDTPEIGTADLAGLRLELARWGAEAEELRWLDSPPKPALAEATDLLRQLGALDDSGRMTAHGAAMAEVAAEPRLAHMLVASGAHDLVPLACDVAAVLSGRDPLNTRSADLRERIEALHGRASGSPRHSAMEQARNTAKRWRRQLRAGKRAQDADSTGLVLALAYPDRIAQHRGGATSYRLSSGRGAELAVGDPLTGSQFLAVADVDGDPAGGRIHLAAPLDQADLEQALEASIVREPVVEWDTERADVVAEHRTRLGALVLKREPIEKPQSEQLAAAWAQGVAAEGLALLTFTREVDSWRHRVGLLRRELGEDWPDLSDEELLATTDQWLAPHLVGVRRRRDLARIDVGQVLRSQLDWRQLTRLDQLAPTHITVPSGSSVRLAYDSGEAPVLAVRVQELFGLATTPAVVDGRVPVVLHLLSPAQRPVQVTTDLASFWSETYPQVKAELMGRYPKHHWPADPMTATPTARTKPRGG